MIREAVIAMVVCALIFVIAGVLRPMRHCSGHCGACNESCELKDQENR